ncbi:putative oligopeptidase B [Rosa chinensis]|uniref:Prolyl endopeptidase n=1 Tax=Rosa chinensis TaxID=74649 RepID=A0A2P6R2A3_ROSCH|nr:putative oligopeptidase B [Rosa chinensis]
MALLSFILNQNCSLRRSLTFGLIPYISSSLFSTLCRDHPSSPAPPLASPPVPKKVPFTVSAQGRTWQDPYRWMSNTDDPDLSDHLNQENSYADAFMADTRSLQRTLVSEMTSRVPTKISTPPELWGPWLYYQYIPEGKAYPVLCRRLEIKKKGWIKSFLCYARGGFGKEEVLLDWNEIAKKYGKLLSFFLMVVCSKLGYDDMENITVFTESDSSFCVDITSTKDGKFITVNSNSRTSSEEGILPVQLLFPFQWSVYLIDSANPLDRLQKVWKRVPGVQYFLEHHHGIFYVLTNAPLRESKEWSGEGYYLARCCVEDILSSNWQNIIIPSEDFSIQDMDMFDGHLVLFLNKKDYSVFCSIDLPMAVHCKHQVKIEDLDPWFFPLPSNSCSVAPGSNHDFQNSAYRVVLSSPVMPDVVVDYDMSTRKFSVVQQEEVMGFCDSSSPANEIDINQTLVKQNEKDKNVQISESQRWKDFSGEYCCERREVISHDGVKVPLTLLYSHTAWKKGRSPGLLHGYGAYGEVLDKSWCTDRLSLLDRGWVVAFADVRGGGGDSSWHKAGSQFNKLNSIYDFVSCGNYLIKEGYVHSDQLGAIGHSAGGLLVGATINKYPDLFRAAILKVPFLDVCNTLMDPSLPLTILDYEEFGNPQIKSQFEHILSYSPYDNISQGSCYPSMLVTASFHDSRVGFWEAAKWVAKVRDSTCPRCSCSVILKTNMTGGHFGEGGRYAQNEETAYDYAFLFKAMGMLKNEK